MRMCLEVHVTATPIRDVGVALRGPEIRVAEHLLHGAQVGATFEEMRSERVPEEVGVHATRLEARALGELAQDEKGAGAREGATAGVEEELGAIAAVEVGATEREVAADGLGGGPAERHEALLATLPEHAHDALLDGDAGLLQPRGLRHAQPGAVQELDECPVTKAARRRPDGGVDQALGLGRRERPR